jgi:hypothetical protein
MVSVLMFSLFVMGQLDVLVEKYSVHFFIFALN